MKELIEGLNEEQKKAVQSNNKRVLILAGAGSGKTQVLTKRVAYLLEKGAEPSSILAVTFTNKAAKEMKERISKIKPENVILSDMWIGTFHSLCNKILKKNHNLAGLPSNFQIIDNDDQLKILKDIIRENLNLFIEYDNKERNQKIKAAASESLKYISQAKDNIKRSKDCSFTQEEFLYYGYNILNIYKEYEDFLINNFLLDFNDILLKTYELFIDSPSIKDYYNNKFRHVLVDEFQDTNKLQYEWVKMLSNNNYLFVVGDDDQSIYGWRGAQIENIIKFDVENKGTEVIKLEQNYRSTNNILKTANYLIDFNTKRKGKNLWSSKGDGEKVIVKECYSPYQEAEYIARKIKENKNFNYSDYAILYRNNSISRILESKLNEFKIPYKIIGGVGFWSRSEIKLMMSYLELVSNYKNNLAFEKSINNPVRGIGKKTIEKIKIKANKESISMFESSIIMINEKSIKGKAAENIKLFLNLISDSAKFNNIKETLDYIVQKTNIINYYIDTDLDKGEERVLNINELLNAAETFTPDNDIDELSSFIDHYRLQSSTDEETDKNSVQLMTIHASKGLEFPYVFLSAFEEGIFPSNRAIEEGNIEEERRLAYVAITRAEKNLEITGTIKRYPNTDSVLSRFVNELPKENVSFFIESNYSLENINKISDSKKMLLLSEYKIGNTINHSKYGTGVILYSNINDNELHLKVDFGFIGVKKLIKILEHY